MNALIEANPSQCIVFFFIKIERIIKADSLFQYLNLEERKLKFLNKIQMQLSKLTHMHFLLLLKLIN